jgi:hypothetical protein
LNTLLRRSRRKRRILTRENSCGAGGRMQS